MRQLTSDLPAVLHEILKTEIIHEILSPAVILGVVAPFAHKAAHGAREVTHIRFTARLPCEIVGQFHKASSPLEPIGLISPKPNELGNTEFGMANVAHLIQNFTPMSSHLLSD